MNCKITKIQDEVIDAEAIAHKLKVNATISDIVKEHFVSVTVTNWPCTLLQTFYVTALKLLSSKRLVCDMSDIKITNDGKLIAEVVKMQLQKLCLDDSIPVCEFILDVAHKDVSKKVMYVRSHDIKLLINDQPKSIDKYVNDQNLFAIGISGMINVKGTVLDQCSMISNEPSQNGIYTHFDRLNMEEKIVNGIMTASGTFVFSYMNNTDAKPMVKTVLAIMHEKIKYLIDNFDESFISEYTISKLTIELCRSSQYAYLIQEYFVMGAGKHYKIDVREIENNSCVLEFGAYDHNYVATILFKQLKVLLADIASLMKQV